MCASEPVKFEMLPVRMRQLKQLIGPTNHMKALNATLKLPTELPPSHQSRRRGRN